MKNSTIRFVVLLAALCIVGITITQIYWVRRAFDLKEAHICNLLEENQEVLNVQGNEVQLGITPFQIITLRLVPKT